MCVGQLSCINVREEKFELGFFFWELLWIDYLFKRWGVGSFVAAIYLEGCVFIFEGISWARSDRCYLQCLACEDVV
jgi:hypothetical protein